MSGFPATVGTGPTAIVKNSTHLFVSNFESDTISKIALNNGDVTTIGSSTYFDAPAGLALGLAGSPGAGLLYVADSVNTRIRIIDTSTDVIATTMFTIGAGIEPIALAINSTHLYAACPADGIIFKINIATEALEQVTGSFPGVTALALETGYLYAANDTDNSVSRISLSDFGVVTISAPGSFNAPKALAINDTHLYVANYNNDKVTKIDLDTFTITSQITIPTTASPFLAALAINSTHLYVAEYQHNEIARITLSDESVTVLDSVTTPVALALDDTYIYVNNYSSNLVSRYPFGAFDAVCFLEGSQILTDEGYRAIEDLRVGDKVKTLHAGYKAIAMIGSSTIYNDATPSRTREKLYVYPEGVVLTGGHSVLKEACTQEEFARIKKSFGRVFVTEGRIRLAAMDDDRASVYPVRGRFNIYNFALEAPHDNMNYGVYAGNGLLVESSFKYWLEKGMNVTAASVEDKACVSFVESV